MEKLSKKSSFVIGIIFGLIIGGMVIGYVANSYVQDLLNQETEVTLKSYPEITKEIIKIENGLDLFNSIKSFRLEGSEKKWYYLSTLENTFVFDNEGNEISCLKTGYISGPSELYISADGEPYYFVDESEDGYNFKRNTYYLKYENGNVISYLKNDEISNTITNNDKLAWKDAYRDIVQNASDTWEYDTQTKFGFIYLDDDNIPELVLGSNSTSVLIYSYDVEKNYAYLLSEVTTGARGATNITYVEKENIIINKSGGMLFESEYANREGCIGGFSSWGSVNNPYNGWEASWSNSVYVYENGEEITENNCSKEIEKYLEKEKDIDLKYNKEEILREL